MWKHYCGGILDPRNNVCCHLHYDYKCINASQNVWLYMTEEEGTLILEFLIKWWTTRKRQIQKEDYFGAKTVFNIWLAIDPFINISYCRCFPISKSCIYLLLCGVSLVFLHNFLFFVVHFHPYFFPSLSAMLLYKTLLSILSLFPSSSLAFKMIYVKFSLHFSNTMSMRIFDNCLFRILYINALLSLHSS